MSTDMIQVHIPTNTNTLNPLQFEKSLFVIKTIDMERAEGAVVVPFNVITDITWHRNVITIYKKSGGCIRCMFSCHEDAKTHISQLTYKFDYWLSKNK